MHRCFYRQLGKGRSHSRCNRPTEKIDGSKGEDENCIVIRIVSVAAFTVAVIIIGLMRLRCLCMLNDLLWNLLSLDFWMKRYVPSITMISWLSRSVISFVDTEVWWSRSTDTRSMCPSPRLLPTKSFNNAFDTSWMICATTRLFFRQKIDASTAFDIPSRILARKTASATRIERIWEFLIDLMQLSKWLNWSEWKMRKAFII